MTGFVIFGTIAAIAGIIVVLTGIRRGPDAQPRNMAMLIGGMMVTAFGLMLTGFAIAYAMAGPLDGAGAAR